MFQQSAPERGRRSPRESPDRKQIPIVGPEQGENQEQNHPSTTTEKMTKC